MKNKLLIIILLVLLTVCPLYANSSYTLSLNGITYEPQHPLHEINQVIYLSAVDIEALTYGKINTDNTDTSVLNIQNHTIRFRPNDRIISVNNKPVIVINMPLIRNKQIYLPIDILDGVKYPYKLNRENLTLEFTATPYARSSTTYTGNLLIETKFVNLSNALKTLLPEDKVDKLIQEAKQKDNYISFIDNTDKDILLRTMHTELLTQEKTYQVAFREIELLTSAPKIASLKIMPLQVSTDFKTLNVEIGEDKISYNCIWAAYNPSDIRLKIDVTKSLDATLMRMLYEYYRDKHNLKDDLYFSPVYPIQTGKVDTMIFTAYYDHILNHSQIYDTAVHKVIEGNVTTYIVDFISHKR